MQVKTTLRFGTGHTGIRDTPERGRPAYASVYMKGSIVCKSTRGPERCSLLRGWRVGETPAPGCLKTEVRTEGRAHTRARGSSKKKWRPLGATAAAQTAFVCVRELNTRSTVVSTVFNILGPVSLIRHTRVGLRFSEHCKLREAFAASRSTALLTAATPLPLPHMCVRSSPRTRCYSPQAS